MHVAMEVSDVLSTASSGTGTVHTNFVFFTVKFVLFVDLLK